MAEREIQVCMCVHLTESVLFGLIVTVCLIQSECSVSTLSRLATVALAACGWRQTQPGGKQPFTAVRPQFGLTIHVYGDHSMEELTLW